MSNASYNSYVRGMRLLGEGHAPLTIETREDYELAERTLESLRSAAIGAGSNTWRTAKDRYEQARKAFRAAPTPCQVTLCFHPCQRLGHGGACEECSINVKTVMHRTCASYGIELD